MPSKIKDLASITSTVVGEIVGCNSYMLERMVEQETTLIKVREGITVGNDLAIAATAEVAQATTDVKAISSKVTKAEKDIKDIGSVSRASLKAAHTVQLREFRNSIIVRGLAPVTKNGVKKNYEDMLAAFQHVLKQAKVPRLRINDLRRFPKVKSAKSDVSASMEVEFVTERDKKSFFRAITALHKSHKTLGVRISNKFPEYTMRANKHLHRLALIVRKENPTVKNKIHISSGELHPILSVKHQGEDEYKKIDEQTLEIAKGI